MPSTPASSNPLAQRLELPCGAALPNRLAKAAMTEGLATGWGHPDARHATLYGRWGAGGVGTNITGNVMVDRRYLERPGNVCVEDEEDLAALEAWTRAGRREGAHLWAQISHPGRQCSRTANATPVAPSAVQLDAMGLFAKPRALEDAEIRDLVGRFATTAGICKKAGFSGVQVHGAHGYLISQFLSPRTNRRTDRWGGDIEARSRFLFEVVAAVRETVGKDFPVALKLNSADFQKGGFTEDDAYQVVRRLDDAGIDLLEISGGTYERLEFFRVAEGTARREAFFLDFAKRVREVCRVPLMVTGGFRTRAVMSEALTSGACDVIGLARPLCVVPDLPRGLLDGTVDAAPTHERNLALGKRWFAPSSRFKEVRLLNAQAQGAWYYAQILRLADGEAPDLALRPWKALRRHFRNEMRVARGRTAEFRRRGVTLR